MLNPKKFEIEFKKDRVFFFHYNKPLSQQRGHPMISIHVANTCYAVNNLVCNVNTKGKINKRQPRFVVTGKMRRMYIEDNVAYIS
jgi:hypothetical protein